MKFLKYTETAHFKNLALLEERPAILSKWTFPFREWEKKPINTNWYLYSTHIILYVKYWGKIILHPFFAFEFLIFFFFFWCRLVLFGGFICMSFFGLFVCFFLLNEKNISQWDLAFLLLQIHLHICKVKIKSIAWLFKIFEQSVHD